MIMNVKAICNYRITVTYYVLCTIIMCYHWCPLYPGCVLLGKRLSRHGFGTTDSISLIVMAVVTVFSFHYDKYIC